MWQGTAAIFFFALCGCTGDNNPADPMEETATQCKDDKDNDQDGFTDCEDSDCSEFVFCTDTASDASDADTDTDSDSDTDVDRDADTDSDSDSDTETDTSSPNSECIDHLASTCAAKRAAGTPEDCIADFEEGTVQAGNIDIGYTIYDGFYAYNDASEAGIQLPTRSTTPTEPAASVTSCIPESRYALRLQASGFNQWGVGVHVDWGGPQNPDCEISGALDCRELYHEDAYFTLAAARADPRCQDPDAEEKLSCLTKGEIVKETKDLSDYIGIGFWVMITDANRASKIKITFPIPDTTRFYGECDNEDDVESTNCSNDFYTEVRLNRADVGAWVYYEVWFDDTTWNPWWGLQLDTLGMNLFPRDQSLGLRFQIDTVFEEDIAHTDLYIDDITLIK